MKLALNGTEFADWQEAWCNRCQAEHAATHPPNQDNYDEGCPLILGWALQEDVPEWQPRDSEWFAYLPARVSCSSFAECSDCPPDAPDAERRAGETRREFHDRLRAEMLALPVYEGSHE